MPAVLHPHQSHFVHARARIQKATIGFGVFNVLMGLAGMVSPGFLGMHMGFVHNLIHFVLAGLAFATAYAHDSKYALNYSFGFGIFLLLFGIVGFIIGTPGYPGIGYMEADQNLFRVIPNIFELGTMDHVLHLLMGAFLLISASSWRSYLSKGSDRLDLERARRGTIISTTEAERFGEINRRKDFGEKL